MPRVLGASLLASGAMRIFLAFSMKRETPWVWVLLSGVITLLLGVLRAQSLDGRRHRCAGSISPSSFCLLRRHEFCDRGHAA
jgi:hypothetical protein